MKANIEKDAIPEGWQRVRLGEVAEVNRSNWDPSDGSSFLYLDLTAVSAPGILSPARLVQAADAPSRARRRVASDDILVSTVRPNLRGFARVREASDNLVASTGFAIVTPLERVDGSFAYHHVMTSQFADHLVGATTGQAYPAVRPIDVETYQLLLPPLPEQRAIAAVLDSIDDAIEGAEAVITATEGLRDALLHDLLTRGLPGQHTEFREVPGLGTIPADWEVVRLGDVAAVQTGRAVKKGSPVDGMLEVPYLSVANVKDGYLDLTVVKTMRVSAGEVERFSLKQGDVLFTEGGDADKLGRGTVWRTEIPVCLHQNHIFAVRPNSGVLTFEFLSLYAGSGLGKRYFLGAAKQTTNLASVNSTQLKDMTLPLPDIREQNAIVSALGHVGVAVEVAREEAVGLRLLKASTADALLTGRMRVRRPSKTLMHEDLYR